jgi:choline dehydrogenase
MQVHFITFSTTKMGDKLHDFPGFTASACFLHPESRGTVSLRGPDPFTPPAIDPNYFSTAADRAANVKALRMVRSIMRAPSMRRYVASEVEPSALLETDEELLAYCRAKASSLYHPVGTVRMGNDSTAVLDSNLQMRAVARLRVVDGSVMPTLLSGNTHAGIVMIAEKAADLILAQAEQVTPSPARADSGRHATGSRT